ncbi:MAG: hypothetical protein WCG22_05590 [Lentisphaerota bacterium]
MIELLWVTRHIIPDTSLAGCLLDLTLIIILSTGDSIPRDGEIVHLLLPHAHHAAWFV